VAKILSLVQDSSIEKQSQILNYENLADQHLLPLVENLTLPLSGKMKYDEKTYNENLADFMNHCKSLEKVIQIIYILTTADKVTN
jgi:hypothetical protein